MTAMQTHDDDAARVVRGCRRDDDGTCHLLLSGELDLTTAEDFSTTVARLLGGGATTLVVDATAVSFIDSTGIGTLLAARRECRAVGGGLTVVQSPGIEKVTRLLGVHDILSGQGDGPDEVARVRQAN
jgi:anti-anti-sigma factor